MNNKKIQRKVEIKEEKVKKIEYRNTFLQHIRDASNGRIIGALKKGEIIELDGNVDDQGFVKIKDKDEWIEKSFLERV